MKKIIFILAFAAFAAFSQDICGSKVYASSEESAKEQALASLAKDIVSRISTESIGTETIKNGETNQRDSIFISIQSTMRVTKSIRHETGKEHGSHFSKACISPSDAAKPYLDRLRELAKGRFKNAVLAMGGKSGKKEAWENVVSIYKTLMGLEGILLPLGQMDEALKKEYEADYARAEREYKAFFAEQSGRCIYLEVRGARAETLGDNLHEIMSGSNCCSDAKPKSNSFTLKITANDCNQKSDGVFDYCGSCAKIELADSRNKKGGYTGNASGRGGWPGKEEACEKAAANVAKEIWGKVAGKLNEACE